LAARAAGISQATCPPYSAENRRVMPADPPNGDPRRAPEPAAHARVEHADRGHARQGLLDQQAPVIQPDDTGGQFHHPQEAGRLVDRDEAASAGLA
jgi:hypothetical protein